MRSTIMDMEAAAMGENLRGREALERANMGIEAIKEIAPAVNNNTAMINILTKMVYELTNRLSAVEIVLTRYLDQNSPLTFSEILSIHIAEMNYKEAGENDGESTNETSN